MEYGILSLIVSADNQACGVVMNIRLHMISSSMRFRCDWFENVFSCGAA